MRHLLKYSGRTGAGLLLAVVAITASAAEPAGTLVVANRDGGSISLIDLETEIEMARLPIGPHIPHEVAVSDDGRIAVTGEYGTGANSGRRLVVIDVPEARIRGYVDLGAPSRPHSFAFLPDGQRIVATLEQTDEIAIVDVENLTVLEKLPTGGRDGHMVRVSPDGTEAYVASRGAEGTLSVIALEDDAPPVVIPTGAGAEGLAVSPDGTEVWVANREAETISIIDTASREVAAVLPARPGARRVEISAAGRVLVPSAAGDDSPGQFLTVYDLESRDIIAERRTGDAPIGYGIWIVAERAFLADLAGGSIATVELAELEPIETLLTEHPTPDGLAYSTLRLDVLVD